MNKFMPKRFHHRKSKYWLKKKGMLVHSCLTFGLTNERETNFLQSVHWSLKTPIELQVSCFSYLNEFGTYFSNLDISTLLEKMFTYGRTYRQTDKRTDGRTDKCDQKGPLKLLVEVSSKERTFD